MAEHAALLPVLESVASSGIAGISEARSDLARYLAAMAEVEPDSLTRDHALAYWINVYNAGALDLADKAYAAGRDSVLGVLGAFDAPVYSVGAERLSLNDIEHGKVRRFGDPRIHAALVCGSVSCPTLRPEPFEGYHVDGQLEAQIIDYLAGGGSAVTGDTLRLARVFMWYGGDFTRSMPALLPARRSALLSTMRRWLPAGAAGVRRVEFMAYDWALGCTVR